MWDGKSALTVALRCWHLRVERLRHSTGFACPSTSNNYRNCDLQTTIHFLYDGRECVLSTGKPVEVYSVVLH